MENLTAIARRDFLDARRSKLVWGVFSLYGIIALLIFVGPTLVSETVNSFGIISIVSSVGLFLLPFIALVAGYLAIAGERESGTVNFLLGLPNTRKEVVLAKFLSRGGLMLAATMLVFVIGVVVAATQYSDPQLALFAPTLAFTALLVLVMVSVAVGISAMTRSRSSAMAGAVGFYFVTIPFNLIPSISIPGLIRYVTNDLLGMALEGDIFQFIQAAISPAMAYQQGLQVVTQRMYLNQYATDLRAEAKTSALERINDQAWYLAPEVMVASLLVWLVVPLAVGYWRFKDAELG
ncbi:ABC transporter permease [Halorubellus salinus]|uniref:ABC transporter permease n=1 Tax=Halorubellus salinus TaxID=755309 RepID=UPI001D087624|nr:ABC transporter permease subunit [Halorubellus salinus]